MNRIIIINYTTVLFPTGKLEKKIGGTKSNIIGEIEGLNTLIDPANGLVTNVYVDGQDIPQETYCSYGNFYLRVHKPLDGSDIYFVEITDQVDFYAMPKVVIVNRSDFHVKEVKFYHKNGGKEVKISDIAPWDIKEEWKDPAMQGSTPEINKLVFSFEMIKLDIKIINLMPNNIILNPGNPKVPPDNVIGIEITNSTN